MRVDNEMMSFGMNFDWFDVWEFDDSIDSMEVFLDYGWPCVVDDELIVLISWDVEPLLIKINVVVDAVRFVEGVEECLIIPVEDFEFSDRFWLYELRFLT